MNVALVFWQCPGLHDYNIDHVGYSWISRGWVVSGSWNTVYRTRSI